MEGGLPQGSVRHALKRRLQFGCDAAVEKKRIGQREHWVPILPSSAE